METNTHYFSDLAIPPGEYLLEAANEMGLTQSDLARRMGRPEQKINEIVKGLKAITPDTALQLEQVLGVPAYIWTGLEADFQLIRARQQAEQQVELEAGDVGLYPYAEMARLGWVSKTRKSADKVVELRRFFGVASLMNLPGVKSYEPAFRKSKHKNLSHEALAAWLRAGVLAAEKVETQRFDKKQLKALLPNLRQMTMHDPEVFLPELRKSLADSGVALVLLPHLSKTYTHGATFWLNGNKSVLMMTIRGKWADVFWFSLFHEIGHILLHNKRQVFLEDGGNNPQTIEQEKQADEFACNSLIPMPEYQNFVQQGDFSAKAIQAFADNVNIAPGIVTGRLRHDDYLALNNHSLREQYHWSDQ